MASITSLTSLTLDLPPSCVAFVPSHPELFVVGTYYLHPEAATPEETDSSGPPAAKTAVVTSSHEDDNDVVIQSEAGQQTRLQKRSGSLLLLRLEGEKISLLDTSPIDAAVLDIQWSPHVKQRADGIGDEEEVLAVATSVGTVGFYRLSSAPCHDGKTTPHLEPILVRQVCPDPATLVLSLAWHPTLSLVLGVTLSDGHVCLIIPQSGHGHDLHALSRTDTPGADQSSSNRVKTAFEVVKLHEHSLEAWTLSFTTTTLSVISGGDDAVLQCSQFALPKPRRIQIRASDAASSASEGTSNDDAKAAESDSDGNSGQQTLWSDRRIHQAGVTAIISLTNNLVITGSYDDHIRLLEMPQIGRGKELASQNLGGGVWRMKLLEEDEKYQQSTKVDRQRPYLILASCMHAGSRIVRLSSTQHDDTLQSEWHFEVLHRFEEHKSMNYGSDVQPRLQPPMSFRPPSAGTGISATLSADSTGELLHPSVSAAASPCKAAGDTGFPSTRGSDSSAEAKGHNDAASQRASSAARGLAEGQTHPSSMTTVVSTSFYDKLLCLWRF